MTFAKELKVGIMAVVAALVLYAGINFMKGSEFFSANKTYFAKFDNVDGLLIGNPVTLNGYQVGQVDQIELLPKQTDGLLVTLIVKREVALTEASVSNLASADLLGGKVIELLVKPGQALEDKDTMTSAKEVGLTDKIGDMAGPVLANLDSVSEQLIVVLKGFRNTGGALNAVLANTKTTTASLNGIMADNRDDIKGITSNLNRLTGNLTETEQSVKVLIGKMNRLGDTLNKAEIAKAVNKASAAMTSLNQVLADVQQGKGTMGKLAKNDSLYRNLNASSAALARLLEDFKARPKRYVHFSVFGKKEK
jgi:phospholipid/cholesterol/gamma-HCH transport system substrate-binding protein